MLKLFTFLFKLIFNPLLPLRFYHSEQFQINHSSSQLELTTRALPLQLELETPISLLSIPVIPNNLTKLHRFLKLNILLDYMGEILKLWFDILEILHLFFFLYH